MDTWCAVSGLSGPGRRLVNVHVRVQLCGGSKAYLAYLFSPQVLPHVPSARLLDRRRRGAADAPHHAVRLPREGRVFLTACSLVNVSAAFSIR